MEPKEITRGTWVAKKKGYTYIGKVVAVYYKLDGIGQRADVEVTYPQWWKGTRNCEGMIHIFSIDDLQAIDPNDYYFMP